MLATIAMQGVGSTALPPGTKVPYTGYSRFASVVREKSEPIPQTYCDFRWAA